MRVKDMKLTPVKLELTELQGKSTVDWTRWSQFYPSDIKGSFLLETNLYEVKHMGMVARNLAEYLDPSDYATRNAWIGLSRKCQTILSMYP